MAAVLIAFIIWLFPGPVLFYRREYKKSAFFLVVSIGVFVAFSIWVSRVALVFVPPGVDKVDSALLKEIVDTHIIGRHRITFYSYELILLGLWVWGVVSTYLSFRPPRGRKTSSPASTDE